MYNYNTVDKKVCVINHRELYSREVLDDYLSRALNIELDESKRLALIDKSDYVLTLDYTIKMLNIHERVSETISFLIFSCIIKLASLIQKPQLFGTKLMSYLNLCLNIRELSIKNRQTVCSLAPARNGA